MNNLSRRCFRLCYAILNNPAFSSRPFCPASIRSKQFCSRHFDLQNAPQDRFEDFEDSCPSHELLQNIDSDSIVGDDAEMKKKLQVVILELSMKLQTQTLLAPKKLKSSEWRTLLDHETEIRREAYLRYLYIREIRKETQKSLRLGMSEHINEKKIREPLTTSSPIEYCLSRTTLFYRVNPLQSKYNFNLALAMMFGEDLIIDCSYEEFMTQSGINSCARHISYLYGCNRVSTNPFNLVLCNLGENSKIMKLLSKTFQNFNKYDYFITMTDKHYLDLYPADKLIYMTPHCNYDMEKYEEDSVYILGAYVDAGKYKPVSSVKAKKDGVRTVRLPLDKHLNWAQGSKLLPFNVCARVLHDVKNGACWQYALRHLDVRKQKFQFFDNDIDITKEQKLAANSVRDIARRNMLYDLNFRGVHEKVETEYFPSSVRDNGKESSTNDGF